MLIRGELQKDAKNLKFEFFESALYTKSGSMPLTKNILYIFGVMLLQMKQKLNFEK